MEVVVTYWQVYVASTGAALAAFWFGWACRGLASAGRHRRGRAAAQLPEALPDAPPVAAAALEAAHANVMARTAPHSPPVAVTAAAAVLAMRATIARAAATAHTLNRFARDRAGGRPWKDATGTFTALTLEDENAA